MSYFEIKINSNTGDNYNDDNYDEYSRADTYTSFTIEGVIFSKKYFDVTLAQEFDPSKPLYLIYASYDTGDSFGCDYGRFEGIDIFQDLEKAKNAVEELEDDKKHEYTRENGKVIKYSKVWDGYFENLNYIEIIEVEVLGHDDTQEMIDCFNSIENYKQKLRIKEELKDDIVKSKKSKKKKI